MQFSALYLGPDHILRRPKKKRRKDDDDDDDDDDDEMSSIVGDEDGLEKAPSSRRASSPLSDLGEDEGDGEQPEGAEDLGRGARTRAKVSSQR